VLACVRDNSGSEQFDELSVQLSLPNVEVTGELVGSLEGGCLEPLLRDQANGPELVGQVMSWTVSDGSLSWDVEVVVEGEQVPSLVGQRVSLDYIYEPGGFGPTHRELSLVSRMSPSHGVWIAEGGDLDELKGLPFQLDRGGSVCAANGSCGDYERYDITATDPLTMASLLVPHGQSTRFGPWLVKHGGYAEATGPGQCLDWFVADVHVAILGLM